MRILKPDLDRLRRCGIPEVVYGEFKSKEDLVNIAYFFLSKCGRIIVTKIDKPKANYVSKKTRVRGCSVKYSPKAKVLVVKKQKLNVKKMGEVGILTAGTSDIPIAEEARIVAEELGCATITEYDVGIAGVHRLYPALKRMTNAGALVVVAGMEGALPSVVSGLVDVPVIGVPTSVGYGVSHKGEAALHTMLNSCTPVAVVNIDNGYGAAVLAYQIVKPKNG